jgi:hypothetical protein
MGRKSHPSIYDCIKGKVGREYAASKTFQALMAETGAANDKALLRNLLKHKVHVLKDMRKVAGEKVFVHI